MSEIGDVIQFPDMQGILSMNINFEKLENMMRFILNMLNKHESELKKGFRSEKGEVISLKDLNDSYNARFEYLEKEIFSNKQLAEELKINLENHENDLRSAQKTISGHSSALLISENKIFEILESKKMIDQNVEDLRKRIRLLREMDQLVLDKSIVQGIEKSREYYPKYTGKQYYISNSKNLTGIFQQNLEKNEGSLDKDIPKQDPYTLTPSQDLSISNLNLIQNNEKLENIEISEQSSVSSEYLKKRSISKTPGPSERLKNGTVFLPHQQSQTADLLDRVKALEKYIEKPGENTEVQKRISKLESMYRFVEGILDSCEPLTLKNRDQITHLARNLKTLESEMTNKLNTEEFEEIRNIVSNLSRGFPKPETQQPAHEINKIKLLEKRTAELEKNFSDLVKVYPENIEEVILKLRRFDQMLKIKISEENLIPLKASLESLNEKLRNIETKEKIPKDKPVNKEKPLEASVLTSINRKVSGIESLIRSLKIPSGLDLTQFWEEISRLSQETQSLKSIIEDQKKQETSKKAEIFQKIEKKIDIENLKIFEDRFSKQIQSLSEKSSQFVLKKDLKKLIVLIEEISKQRLCKSNQNEDDAIIAKKPLVGWSCASCEKKLSNLSNKLPSHTSWNRLPSRDASERMLKAGPGYSKMLTTLQLDSIRNKSEEESISSHKNLNRSHTPYL